MSRRRRLTQVTIPHPQEDLVSLHRTVLAIKELVEELAGQRGDSWDVAVTWEDLRRLNWITEGRVPRDIGSDKVQ